MGTSVDRERGDKGVCVCVYYVRNTDQVVIGSNAEEFSEVAEGNWSISLKTERIEERERER